MARGLPLLLTALSALAAVAAPVPPEDDAARMRQTYGVWADPDDDARYVLADGKLRIILPDRPGLDQKQGRQAAMMGVRSTRRNAGLGGAAAVRREVTGDFTATVRVSFPTRRKGPELFDTDITRVAGVGVWVGEKEHLGVARVEKTALERRAVALQTIYTHPDGIRTAQAGASHIEEAVFLRLVRDGRKITTWGSRDGKEWAELDTEEVEWPAAVRVGVYAKNVAGEAFTATFDQYTLTQPKK